jgi:ubiquinone biosynthesis protein
MQMRPELLLLQKTMVVVEGVARSLDPKLNMWVAAEPVVREWIIREAGPAARLRDAVQDAAHLVQSLRQIPQLVERGSALLNKIGVTPESNAVGAAAGSSAQRAITGVTTMLLWRGFVAICLIIILVKLFWQ